MSYISVYTDVEVENYEVSIDLGAAGQNYFDVDVEIEDYEVVVDLDTIANQIDASDLQTVMEEMDEDDVATAIIGIYDQVMPTVVEEGCDVGLQELVELIARTKPEIILKALKDNGEACEVLIQESKSGDYDDEVELHYVFSHLAKNTEDKRP